jgi:hypothetical protein
VIYGPNSMSTYKFRELQTGTLMRVEQANTDTAEVKGYIRYRATGKRTWMGGWFDGILAFDVILIKTNQVVDKARP